MSLQLTIISLDFESDTTPITTRFDKDVISFGSASNNDVVLEQDDIAEYHLELRVESDSSSVEPRIFATDLGSTSGTLVENMPLHPHLEKEMAPNERIIIGSYLVKAKVVPSPQKAEKPTPETAKRAKPSPVNKSIQSKTTATEPEAKVALDQKINKKSRIPSTADVPQSIIKVSPFGARPSEEPSTVEYYEAIEERPINSFSNLSQTKHSSASEQSQFLVSGQLDADDLNHVDFEAVKLLALKGIVTHHGTPLAGVHIDGGKIGQTVTGPEGTFAFSDIEEYTPYAVTASKAGFDFSCDAAQGTLSNDIVLEFVAKELYSITGSVLHRGQPLAQVEIDGGELGVTVTDRNGHYTFSAVPEGSTFNLKASKKSYRFECRDNLGKVRNNLNIDFKAIKLVQLSGIISHQGNPLEGVEIDGGALGKTTTSADGRYYFNDIPEGTRYTLSASKAGFRFQKRAGNI